jgi:uncharacterized membrane protein/thiol-disulfide isomerase/thioredoxin
VKPRHIFFLLILSITFLMPYPVAAQNARAVVRAVLFYSPSCGHCHYVMTETLPPLLEKYGEQLQIIGVDVTQPQGQALFLSALQKFGQESGGVPFLVIGETFLVGSLDIPEKLPGLIEHYLALGGVDWPDIPGLREAFAQSADVPAASETAVDEPTASVSSQPTLEGGAAAVQPQPTAQPPMPEPASTSQAFTLPGENSGQLLTDDQSPNWRDNFLRDPAGNTLSVIVLLGMVGALLWTWKLFNTRSGILFKGNWDFALPALCLVGFFVAGYLAYVETSQTTAVCGPVGDCNTVQQSEYARLFGILPIGVLGLAGYSLIALAWLVARFSNNGLADMAAISLFLMTASGTLFSIYLTFLEPFVIGATCAWCLTSALLMTLLMLLTAIPAKSAFYGFKKTRSYSSRYR